MRIRSTISAVSTAALTITLAVVGGGLPASATETALGRCRRSFAPQFTDQAPWFAPGNLHTPWAAPAGLETEDALRITAAGTVRIDYWGTTKNIAGELPVAGSGWPAPGEPRYMLIAKVTAGSVWLHANGRSYGAGAWFPVGTDSGCMSYSSAGPSSQLVFSYNDPNLGDNAGGAAINVKQWWGITE
ncbi:hypothetical protein GCM10027290_39860 [Micromonospora sonneratiae]|jgi:hypothetical protein|uniref:Uncharacterized protein n=1 Tax=Micromonospora sonneratiae TaxID=1184706 RepID=A0ABW3YCC1_9ACTN